MKSHLRRATVTGALVVATLAACHAEAAILRVPADYPTIQAGINAAGFGDTVLVAPGTYYERVLVDSTRDGVILVSEAGPEWTTIDGQNVDGQPLVRFSDVGHPTALVGFTLLEGRVGVSGGSKGGGVRCRNSSVRIESNVIDRCFARYSGGGIFAEDCGDLSIVDNTVRENEAGDGAGICIEGGTAVVSGNEIIDNVEGGWFSYAGGGIAAYGCVITIIDNRILRNVAHFGGGILLEGGVVASVQNNVLDSNWGGNGGAMSLTGAAAWCADNVIVATGAAYPEHGAVLMGCRDWNPDCNAGTTFESNVIFGNEGVAFGIERGALPTIIGNSLEGDGSALIRVGAEVLPGVLCATGNWWGTSDPDSIAGLIYDCNDDPNVPACVDFSAWCTDPSCDGQVTDVPEAPEPAPSSWGKIKGMYR